MEKKGEMIYMWRVFRRESRVSNAPERASEIQTKECPFGLNS